ncbi:pentapeptide repeat-containing protein [Litorivita sp. NS0012-18]|uniref:pentapeptide repeat-containing protein n=1 Tax=Litorivita sp. NS0012-18 TaxID=3127655 RepID=UPI003109E585
MANPQHIEWLLEGVAAWNLQRRRLKLKFRPDLSDSDIRASFEQKSKIDTKGRFDLRQVNFAATDLRNSRLECADLDGANLEKALLQGADLSGAILSGANLNGARLKGAKLRTRANEQIGEAAHRADLKDVKGLTQTQLSSMDGDSGTIIPSNLTRPARWPEFDTLPDTLDQEPYGDAVTLVDGRLAVSASALPSRDDLEQIFHDLTEDLRALKTSGNFGNISTLLHTAFDRFLSICDVPYGDMDQIRFGVQSKALRLQFEATRAELQDYAPDKSAALEAALLSAELISSRLPDWLEFLSETAPERPEMDVHQTQVDAELQRAAEQLENHPEHFAPTLAARMREYVDTKSMEAYFAAVGLLNNIAYTTFNGLRRVVKGVAEESEKQVYTAVALTIHVQIGGALAKLAGILPAELEWILPWLRYVEAMLK